MPTNNSGMWKATLVVVVCALVSAALLTYFALQVHGQGGETVRWRVPADLTIRQGDDIDDLNRVLDAHTVSHLTADYERGAWVVTTPVTVEWRKTWIVGANDPVLVVYASLTCPEMGGVFVSVPESQRDQAEGTAWHGQAFNVVDPLFEGE